MNGPDPKQASGDTAPNPIGRLDSVDMVLRPTVSRGRNGHGARGKTPTLDLLSNVYSRKQTPNKKRPDRVFTIRALHRRLLVSPLVCLNRFSAP
ncbi:hypothetical protein IL54_4617 [Sphingobium sp. ba1]|jgi:hypothetical protein|nr:hypothetical protein IL54_4617 [Sphingobium sp. ba1]